MAEGVSVVRFDGTIEACRAWLHAHRVRLLGIEIGEAGAADVDTEPFDGPTALMLGNEVGGLVGGWVAGCVLIFISSIGVGGPVSFMNRYSHTRILNPNEAGQRHVPAAEPDLRRLCVYCAVWEGDRVAQRGGSGLHRHASLWRVVGAAAAEAAGVGEAKRGGIVLCTYLEKSK